MLNQLLIQSGLSGKEVQIYLYLLEEGSKTAQDVTKATKIKRGNVYYLLGKLEEQGLIEKNGKSAKTIFSVKHPKIWEAFFKRKKREIEQSEKRVWDKLSDMVSKYKFAKGEDGIYVFEGRQDIIKLYQKLLDDGENIDIIAGEGRMPEFIPDFAKFFLKTLSKNKIKTRIILNKANKFFEEDAYKEIKMADTSVFPLHMEVNITKKKLILLSFEPDRVLGIVLILPEIVKNFQTLFEYFWAISKQISRQKIEK